MELEYYIVYKPYQVLAQFKKDNPSQHSLLDLYDFPKGLIPIYPMDKDTEGLVLLTKDKTLSAFLHDAAYKALSTFYVQVEGIPTRNELQLMQDLFIKIDNRYNCTIKRITSLPEIPVRTPPIRYRKNVPTTWVSITVHERVSSKIRKVLASCNYPVLRMIKYYHCRLNAMNMSNGEVLILNKNDMYIGCGITPPSKAAPHISMPQRKNKFKKLKTKFVTKR